MFFQPRCWKGVALCVSQKLATEDGSGGNNGFRTGEAPKFVFSDSR